MIVADASGRIEWVNDAFARMTGYSPDEVVGQKAGAMLQGPEIDPKIVVFMRERVRSGEGFNVEVLNYAKSGRSFWLSIDSRPVRDERGELSGFIAVEADVIERRRAAEEILRLNIELESAYDATIEGWATALELHDRETEGHSRRVTAMTLRLARALGIPVGEMAHVRRGALLHDVGKMGVPDVILLKPGPLSAEEQVVMRMHPELACRLLRPIAFLAPSLDSPRCHHERWDGGGYPRGLRGEEIPLSARIFAAVDIWDALSHDRPYRGGEAGEAAREFKA